MKLGFAVTILVLLLSAQSAAVAQQSLFSDVKANQVGDIITVVLTENISGSSTADNRRSSNSNGSASGSVSGNFIPFEPTFGGDAQVNYGADAQNRSNQRQLLEGLMSVQIIEVTALGDLIVEGTRSTEINGETHEMSLTGIIRQNDVDSRNRVLSYRVANANISYQQKGGLYEITKKQGRIRRIVLGGVGLVLGAAIFMNQ
ncbi:flagellar basal body L-ring protein FlgH [Rhodohalobacter sp. 8-1]|uniref:flagellar basal body L-ring protein FlgH n=1 Tax=Rhodohalobacter sp. 8-1 TaxID=3131972 RepID=UPI0030EF2849